MYFRYSYEQTLKMEEVVFLDSDDEQETKVNIDTNKNEKSDNNNDANDPDDPGEPGDADIVMEYNHKDYADLVGPIKTTNGAGPQTVRPTNNVPRKIPKRPGTMPPFALFSQEMRAKLQQDDPEMGFGDLGRKLGEMWHALKEEEKEEYRRRARKVADERMSAWKRAVSSLSPQKRQIVENQQRASMNKIKRKRTSGYNIFCSEYRRKLAQEQPDLPFSDVSKSVAEDWKNLSTDKRQSYEMRAQKFNSEEDRRWRQRMLMQQKAIANRQQIQQAGRGLMLGRGTVGMSSRGQFRNILPKPGMSRGRGGNMVYNNAGRGRGQGNQSGLVISSVSSLSASQNNYSLPSGISISKAADPDINLPRSISISRVEPEIQIVEESVPARSQQTVIGSTVITRGRGGSVSRGRGVGTNVIRNVAPRTMQSFRGRMVSPSRGRPPMLTRGGAMMANRGRGMSINSPVKRILPSNMSTVSPAKRMGSVMTTSPMANMNKRPRMHMPVQASQSNYVPG